MEVREGGVALVIDDAGATYPVRVDPMVWTQQAELTASDGGADDWFGVAVSVSGDTALVGVGPQVGANAAQGAAYVFVQSGATWTQQAELIASDGAVGDCFGTSVSVSGGTAVVGASLHDVGANADQGAAYVFVQSGTTWTQQAELTASDGAANDELRRVGVGERRHGPRRCRQPPGRGERRQGAAYVFVQSGTTWTQQAELTASDGAAVDYFGGSVSVSDGTALVGARNHQVGANATKARRTSSCRAAPRGPSRPSSPRATAPRTTSSAIRCR